MKSIADNTFVTSEDKSYFYDMLVAVAQKLHRCPKGSLVREYFPDARLEAIRKKIESGDAPNLELGTWQPFFMFLKRATDEAILSLDDDLRIVVDQAPQRKLAVCSFLGDERETGSSWTNGLFEVYVRAALLRSDFLAFDAPDFKLENGRDIDAMVRIGDRLFGVEITTRGETDAATNRWGVHCKEVLNRDMDQAFGEFQDAYAPGRWLYGTVYNKLAQNFDTSHSQFLEDTPNLLLIGLWPSISDLTANSPSIGLALDELFASQPTQSTSPISLQAYLRRNIREQSSTLENLLSAPSRISGVLLFDQCRLKVARINYNAREPHRITHEEMALFEKTLACPPVYCC